MLFKNNYLCRSLPLNRRRRLPRNVVHHARNPRHLIDHAMRHAIEKPIRQSRPARRHEIVGLHGAQRDHIVVAPPAAADRHAPCGPCIVVSRSGTVDREVGPLAGPTRNGGTILVRKFQRATWNQG